MRNTWLNTVFLIIIWDMIDSMYFYILRAVRLIYCICIHLHLFALKSHVAPCKKDGDKFETWNIWEENIIYTIHIHQSLKHVSFVFFCDKPLVC